MRNFSMDPRTALKEYAEALKAYLEAPAGKEQEEAYEDLCNMLDYLLEQGSDMVSLIEDFLSQSEE